MKLIDPLALAGAGIIFLARETHTSSDHLQLLGRIFCYVLFTFVLFNLLVMTVTSDLKDYKGLIKIFWLT